MRPGRWSAAAVSLAMSVGGCSRSQAPARPLTWPQGAPEVPVVMNEYRFDYNASQIPSGRVVFRVHNRGRLTHRFTVLPLPEDIPPIDVQLHGSERRILPSIGSTLDRQPGSSTALAVDLVPGTRYAFICFVVDADEVSHALKGMNSEFRVRVGDQGQVPAPRP